MISKHSFDSSQLDRFVILVLNAISIIVVILVVFNAVAVIIFLAVRNAVIIVVIILWEKL